MSSSSKTANKCLFATICTDDEQMYCADLNLDRRRSKYGHGPRKGVMKHRRRLELRKRNVSGYGDENVQCNQQQENSEIIRRKKART